jgi:hypothetical protein
MKRLNFIYFLTLILACTFSANAQDVHVNAHLDQQTLKIGDQTQLRLSVHQPVKARVNFPQITDSLTEKVMVLGAGKLDTVVDKNTPGIITVNRNYTITAFDSGTYTIPPLSFGSDAGVLTTNPIILTVQTVQVDTTKAIYDIKQPLAVSYTLWDWLRDHWVIVCIVLAVILIIIGIVWYIKTRPEKVVVIEEIVPDVPIHTQAINKLNELRAKKLWQQGDIKGYHSELSDIIREYLEKRYVIKTQEKTTDEIFTGLKYLDIEQENRNLLRQMLLLADLVKFAKEKSAPAENEQSMDNAIAFVTKTSQVSIAPKPTEGGDSAAV